MSLAIRKTMNVLAPVVATVTLGACGAAAPAAENAAQPVVPLAVAEVRTLDIRAEAAGMIEPILEMEVKSKASGEVLALHVETGDEVEAGELLAEIDPRDVRNQLAQTEADLEVARARVSIAESQFARAEELRDAGVITGQEYETASLELATARSELVKAETNLQLAQERMGDVRIDAPISGVVLRDSVEVGQIIASAGSNVSGGTTLLVMADLSEMQVRTMVDETDVGRIAPGQGARVMVQAYPGRTFVGEVAKIEPQAVVDQNVTMFPVLIRLENDERLLKPGMNAEVVIEIARRENVMSVASSAVASMANAVEVGAALGVEADAVLSALRGGMNRSAEGTAVTPASVVQSARDRGPERAGGARPGGGTRPGGTTAGGAGVVFVAGPDGPQPRRVALGMSDWEYTEIVRGLEPGEEVYIVSVAMLQQQQERFTDRIRERAGGIFPGS